MRDLAGGALVVFVGKLARASCGAFLWAITLLCGADVMGLYTTAWAVCSTLNKVARFGLTRSVVHFVTAARTRGAANRRGEHAALGAGLWIAAFASAAGVLAIYLTADHIAAFYDKPIARALRIMAWTAPFVACTWILTSATRALRIMRYEVYVRSVGGPLILFVGGVAVGLAGFGLEAIAWVQLAMAVGNPDLIKALTVVKSNLDSGIPQAIQQMAIEALDGPQDCVDENVAIYHKRRDRLVAGLAKLGLRVHPPKASFYLWARVPAGFTSAEYATKLLDEASVVVTPGSA